MKWYPTARLAKWIGEEILVQYLLRAHCRNLTVGYVSSRLVFL